MELDEQPLSYKLRDRFIMVAIASSLTLALALALAFVLTLQGFTGITSTPPLQLKTCSSNYYSSKYSSSSITTIVPLNYAATILSIVFQIVVCVLVFPPLVKRQRPSENKLIATILLVFLDILSALLTFGKNLAFEIDFHSMDSNCSVSYSQVLIKLILALAASLFLCSLLQVIFALRANSIFNKEGGTDVKYQTMANATNNTLETMLDQQAKAMYSLRERMPIQIPTVARAFQSSLPKNREEIYKQNSLYERKETYLGEESKSEMKPKRGVATSKSKIEVVNKVYQYTTQGQAEAPNFNKIQTLPARQNQSRFQQVEQRSKSGSHVQEQSLQSLMKYRREESKAEAAPTKLMSAKKDLRQLNKDTQGYLNFVRRMNVNQRQIAETQEELIASIRGKYSKQ